MTMKKYLGIFVSAWLVIVFSCKKEKDLAPDCSDCGSEVEKIIDRKGTISYDSTTSRYFVYMHTPGSIDAFIAGYVCDLPSEYQEIGKQVVVNGTTYETSIHLPIDIICCVTEHCLALSSIREQ